MKNKKLLFVEDNLVAAEAIRGFLSNRWGHLDVANNAEEAYEMFLKSAHDIIITDIYLPDMDGFELIKKIRAINKNTTILVVSANSSQESTKKAKELGASRFFPKPIDLDMLEAAINEAISNKNLP